MYLEMTFPITVIFEGDPGSCRCICVCSPGLGGKEQTVLCNHGNSETGQQDCTAVKS